MRKIHIISIVLGIILIIVIILTIFALLGRKLVIICNKLSMETNDGAKNEEQKDSWLIADASDNEVDAEVIEPIKKTKE
ncbi:hypothetical protein ACJDT4_16495 [Clostridium neuense]|uniref:Secreted protein n=1 Tax=Clostridium neuense TaxID=1728934 RepID=A0ABW8THJ9_9CLOT